MTNARAKRLAQLFNRDFWYNREWRSWVVMPIHDDGREAQYLSPGSLHALSEQQFIENYLMVESEPNNGWVSNTFSSGIRIIRSET